MHGEHTAAAARGEACTAKPHPEHPVNAQFQSFGARLVRRPQEVSLQDPKGAGALPASARTTAAIQSKSYYTKQGATAEGTCAGALVSRWSAEPF